MAGKRKNVSVVFVLPVLLGFLCLCFFFCCLSCKLKSTDMENAPGQNISFSKIFDKNDKSNYTAVDIKQTGDGGYIILGRKDNHPYLLKVNWEGIFQWDTADDEDLKIYTDPIADLIIFNQEYYFFCNEMGGTGSPLALLKTSENNHKAEKVIISSNKLLFLSSSGSVIRPLSAFTTHDEKFLFVVFYENFGKLVVGKINSQGEGDVKSYQNFIRCNNLYPLIDKRFHISGIVEPSGSGANFFQSYLDGGFLEFPTCFRIITIAPSDKSSFEDNFKNGFNLETPFIAMVLNGTDWKGTGWQGIKISGARIDNGIISFFVNIPLEDVDGEEGDRQTELIPVKAVYVKVRAVNSQPVVFFAGSTKNNRIMLYAYDWSTSEFLDKKDFGHTHIYEAAGLHVTDDGGLAILGTTFVAGRLGRICLFKLSKADLEDIIIPPNRLR